MAHVQSPGLHVKAIRLRGADITDEVVKVIDGIDLDGLEVELTNVGQTLSGRVSTGSERDEVVEDLAVVLFPVDHSLWVSNRRTVLARVDKGGEFVVRTLPPGSYAAAVVPLNDGLNLRDPRFLESLQERAKTVSLTEGSSVSVVLSR